MPTPRKRSNVSKQPNAHGQKKATRSASTPADHRSSVSNQSHAAVKKPATGKPGKGSRTHKTDRVNLHGAPTGAHKQREQKGTSGSSRVSNTNMATTMWTKGGAATGKTAALALSKSLGRSSTRDSERSSRGSGTLLDGFRMVFGYLVAGIQVVGKGIVWAAVALANLCRRNKVALAVVIALVALGLGYVVDTSVNLNKVNNHVSIGTVDVSGMTLEQAEQAVADTYSARLNSGSVTVYANQQAMDAQAQNPDVDEYISVEEAASQVTSWNADANSLQARIDYESLAKQAMQKGRGGFFDRLQLFFGNANVTMHINYNSSSIEALCQQVDTTLGDPYVNWGIKVADGVAIVTEGHDGNMVNRTTFTDNLTDKFLCDPTQQRAFVAKAEYTPVQIDQSEAQTTADLVTTAISSGVTFTYEDQTWTANAADLGSWVQTTVASSVDGDQILQPSFSASAARAQILTHIQPTFTGGTGTVSFESNNGTIMVNVDGKGQMPQISDAVLSLNRQLFTNGDRAGAPLSIRIEGANIPNQMSFDDALSYGVIAKIHEYTTEYTSGAAARNHNIQLAATLLDKSIAKANGGEWSFNGVAGECNAEKGFQAAGVIVDNDYTDEIGGGICQVATTVFNAVYEAGYPITQRTNHSLYTSSYPIGRDAAISWPDLNLRWENDSTSDVLMRTSSTDTTVTCTLYGIDPDYKVSTVVGDWQEGEKYKTKYTYNATLTKGYSYTKTNGVDGKSITVTRKVTDADGNLLRTDYFNSTYAARDEVIVRGGSKDDYSDEPQTNPDSDTKG